jgi:uncharacterized protein YdcH (DUF465 family)
MSQSVAVREKLLEVNEEYRRLNEQHREFESRLTSLTSKPTLSDDELIEETTLKKKKLQVKDRMEAIARDARAGAS